MRIRVLVLLAAGSAGLSLVAAPGDAVGSKDAATGPVKTPKEAAERAQKRAERYYKV